MTIAIVPNSGYISDFSGPIHCFGNFTRRFNPRLKPLIDLGAVERKLGRLRAAIANGDFTSVDEKVRSRAMLMLRDKTCFAYYFLRYEQKPIELNPVQDIILSDTHDRVLFCGPNQVLGKSFCLNVDAAIEFMQDHAVNWIGIVVSGTLPQSQFQMDRIKFLLKTSGIEYREEDTYDTKTGKKDNSTQISYTFYDSDGKPLITNRLICCPHTSSALGYPCNKIWLDEIDFWENCDQMQFINKIAIPRTFRTGGSIMGFSNPNGKEGAMHELFTFKNKKGQNQWHRYQFNYWDMGGASQEHFDKLSEGMTEFEIESTLLAIFSRTLGSMFSSLEIEDTLNDQDLIQKGDMAGDGRETAWFLDVGTVHDQCSLTGGYVVENKEVPGIPLLKAFWIHKYPVGYPLGLVVGLERGQLPDGVAQSEYEGWEDYAEDNPSVRETLTQFSELSHEGKPYFPLFGFDATNNEGMLPLFQTVGIDPVPIKYSGPKKWAMYQRYQYYVQERFLKRCPDRDDNTVNNQTFSRQMGKLIVKKTKNATYRKIHHENDSDFDDTQDSMVGFIHLIENPDLPSLAFSIINDKGQIVISSKGKVEDPENEAKLESLKKENEIEDQYIPSFYDAGEFEDWMDKKMNDRH